MSYAPVTFVSPSNGGSANEVQVSARLLGLCLQPQQKGDAMPPLFPHQPKPIRVLIVDDHAGYAASLTAILSGNPRLVVVGRAVDGLDAIELARLLRPDVVVMDVNMPRLDGFSASRLIRRDREDVRIVIVSGEPRLDHPSRARQAGADVYLPKDVDFVTLTNVVAGETSGEEPGTFSVAFATAI